MLIYYLQRIEVPVLPFLQDPETFELADKPYGKHRIQFARPTDEFRHKFRKNNATVGELFTGFFDFFVDFDWHDHVVQIRTRSTLYKLDKGWQQRSMAIEDPFDLDHNLSGGVHCSSEFFNVYKLLDNFLDHLFILKCMNEMQLEFRKPNNVFLKKVSIFYAQCKLIPILVPYV
jgi:hypothetical protein